MLDLGNIRRQNLGQWDSCVGRTNIRRQNETAARACNTFVDKPQQCQNVDPAANIR
jgi:hypothetical protein